MVAIRQTENIKRNYRLANDSKIISGYFNKYVIYKETVIAKVNSTLSFILFLLVLLTVGSYYFTSLSEVKLNELRKDVISINDENIELQNKLDYLSSFYNVDRTIKNAKLLDTAKRVMEVDVNNNEYTQNSLKKNKPKKQKKIFNPTFKLSNMQKDANHKYMIGY